MPENLDTIHSKSTSHLAGSVPGTEGQRVSVLAPSGLTVGRMESWGSSREGHCPRWGAVSSGNIDLTPAGWARVRQLMRGNKFHGKWERHMQRLADSENQAYLENGRKFRVPWAASQPSDRPGLACPELCHSCGSGCSQWFPVFKKNFQNTISLCMNKQVPWLEEIYEKTKLYRIQAGSVITMDEFKCRLWTKPWDMIFLNE